MRTTGWFRLFIPVFFLSLLPWVHPAIASEAAKPLAARAAPAVAGPELMGFQGDLRDGSGKALNGTYPMTFRLYDAASGGTLLLTDAHTGSGALVTVADGLFETVLGAGAVTPGSQLSLGAAFANLSSVWLEIQVSTETLTPRMRVTSAAYAQNARTLDGKGSAEFAGTTHQHAGTDVTSPVAQATSATTATSAGDSDKLDGQHAAAFAGSAHGHAGTDISGPVSQATSATTAGDSDKLDGQHAAAFAVSVHGHAGTDISGPVAQATSATTATSATSAGNADTLDGEHATAFADSVHAHDASAISTGTLAAARGGTGLASPGASGNLLTSNGTAWASSAPPSASSLGAVVDAADTSLTRSGAGTGASPYKLALNLGKANTWAGAQTFSANTNFPGSGIWTSSGLVGIGLSSPLFPLDIQDQVAVARLQSSASQYGSVLELRNNTTSPAPTHLGAINFNNPASTWPGQIAYLTSGHMTFRTDGAERMRITPHGLQIGTSVDYYMPLYAVGSGNIGMFVDQSTGGLTGTGVLGYGRMSGGYFNCTGSSGRANVGYYTYKVNGTGSVSFVQNHPTLKDRVVVYNCPEGDEVATYTRGTARLANGIARVRLGETFQWVTNPDLGLTAHLTPRGAAIPLAVESLSTTELVVRGPAEGPQDAAFDYLVYGLRIGFEETSILQEKREESFIPAFAWHREAYARHPELRPFNALERFKGMESAVRGTSPEALDLSRARALKDAIHEYDPATDPPARDLSGRGPELPFQGDPAGWAAAGTAPEPASAGNPAAARREGQALDGAGQAGSPSSKLEALPSPVAAYLPVCEAVEAGDVLVADPAHPGAFCLGRQAADPKVVGIASSPASAPTGEAGADAALPLVPVTTSGILNCKVDATHDPIVAGDLLTTSPTPGHAQKAQDSRPGTVVGKALEALATGTGSIQVVVMLR